jgi:hypothetical protein
MSEPTPAPATRGRAAIVLLTAAMTLALGVTAAALGGYLRPRDASVAVSDPAPGATPRAPTVGLVPITPTQARPAAPAARVVASRQARADDDDDHERRGGDDGGRDDDE